MTKRQFLAALKSHEACKEAYAFCVKAKSPQTAWDTCVDSSYLNWLILRTAPGVVPLEVRGAIAREIALSVSHLWKITPTCREYLEKGNPALREQSMEDAADAAYAYAAAAAAYAADAASYAAGGNAAYAYAYAADAAAAAAGRSAQLARNCEIIRKHIPACPVLEVRE